MYKSNIRNYILHFILGIRIDGHVRQQRSGGKCGRFTVGGQAHCSQAGIGPDLQEFHVQTSLVVRRHGSHCKPIGKGTMSSLA